MHSPRLHFGQMQRLLVSLTSKLRYYGPAGAYTWDHDGGVTQMLLATYLATQNKNSLQTFSEPARLWSPTFYPLPSTAASAVFLIVDYVCKMVVHAICDTRSHSHPSGVGLPCVAHRYGRGSSRSHPEQKGDNSEDAVMSS
ncbi:hypothetical protein CPC08DRAFT_715979 [Agrocybe pediades]|nr:hypothetical protein CPC08DRAFT_715979 [Agrocybe pediades]